MNPMTCTTVPLLVAVCQVQPARAIAAIRYGELS